jgi:hypothetical protein
MASRTSRHLFDAGLELAQRVDYFFMRSICDGTSRADKHEFTRLRQYDTGHKITATVSCLMSKGDFRAGKMPPSAGSVRFARKKQIAHAVTGGLPDHVEFALADAARVLPARVPRARGRALDKRRRPAVRREQRRAVAAAGERRAQRARRHCARCAA